MPLAVQGVPRRQSHRRSRLARPGLLWEPSPSHPILVSTRDLLCFLYVLYFCSFSTLILLVGSFDRLPDTAGSYDNPYCVGGDVKPCSVNRSINPSLYCMLCCVVDRSSVADASCPARWVVYPNSHSGTYAKHAESATTKRRCLDYCVADDWCIAVEWGNFGNCRVFYKNLRRRSLPSITQFVIDRQCGTASGVHVQDFTICITSVSK